MKLLVSLILLVLLSLPVFAQQTPAARYLTPTSVTPIPYPAAIPCPSFTDSGCPTGALTGADWYFTDPGFSNTPMARATDVNSYGPLGAANRNWGLDCGGSA